MSDAPSRDLDGAHSGEEVPLEAILKAKGVTPEEFMGRLVHPFASALAERIWVSPDDKDIKVDEQVLDAVQKRLEALAGTGLEFYEAFRQVMNLAFALHERYPDSLGPAEILGMLDRVSQAAEPKLQEEDLKANQAAVDQIGDKFRNFVDAGGGERLPDTGQRLDPKPFKGPIRG